MTAKQSGKIDIHVQELTIRYAHISSAQTISQSVSACVVSVSGGIDSAVTVGLLDRAKKHPNTPIKEIVAVAQPIHSTGSIQNRAFEHCEELDVKCITVDQSELHTQLTGLVEKSLNVEANAFSKGQLRSYMRTPVNYFVAQLLAQQGKPAIVLGTGNYDEDGYLLYYCKCGDGIADVQLINDLHKSEVYTVGSYLNVPESILTSKPSADLWEGQTDEDELGFGYDAVELYTAWKRKDLNWRNQKSQALSHKAAQQFKNVGEAIEAIHQRNKHKLNFPVNLNYQMLQ